MTAKSLTQKLLILLSSEAFKEDFQQTTIQTQAEMAINTDQKITLSLNCALL